MFQFSVNQLTVVLLVVFVQQALSQDDILTSYPILNERVERCKAEMQRGRGKAIIFGRVVLEGDEDPIYVKSQMEILPGGFFADVVKDLERPVGFRMHQYQPYDLELAGREGDLINVGVLQLRKLPQAEQVSLSGEVQLEGSVDASGVKAFLTVANGPVNTPSNGTEPRRKWPQPIEVEVNDQGQIEMNGLSPIRYYFWVEAPGYVKDSQYVTISDSDSYSLGTVNLEKVRKFQLHYLVSPTAEFESVLTQVADLETGTTWKATPDIYGFDLKFGGEQGKVIANASYAPCSLADLGPGSLQEFLDIDHRKAQRSVRNNELKDGHVYLLNQQFWKRYILFRFELK